MNFFRTVKNVQLQQLSQTNEYEICLYDMRTSNKFIEDKSKKKINIYIHGKPSSFPFDNIYSTNEISVSSPFKFIHSEHYETPSFYGRRVRTCFVKIILQLSLPLTIIIISLNNIFGKQLVSDIDDVVLSPELLLQYYLHIIFPIKTLDSSTIICGDFLDDLIYKPLLLHSNSLHTEVDLIQCKDEELEQEISKIGDNNDIRLLVSLSKIKSRVGSLARSELVALALSKELLESVNHCSQNKLYKMYLSQWFSLMTLLSSIANASKSSVGVLNFIKRYTDAIKKITPEKIKGGLVFFHLFRSFMKHTRLTLQPSTQIKIIQGTLNHQLNTNDIDWINSPFPSLFSFEINDFISPSFGILMNYFYALSPEIQFKVGLHSTHLHVFYTNYLNEQSNISSSEIKCINISHLNNVLQLRFILFKH
ncbi:hypothetical protein CL6EHI_201190 [Entamoeba histolytica]|uniref:Uncharacterized protein n=3 Tax=Entamoeba histolytica TaxID=5759 RepID=C4M6P8_ENTH1|nr:hypothetical protein EHI_201190 [Entamoeba histolytica HM-1:IMSS]EAL44636.1 hypothetical protein EHI_201190 [Entamoeba histolytica HM-1:IMSS]ENY60609.1 hypothetical protein EHI7A_143660 [Entamoeba histolytica HM-1:IMSS-A]GAT97170.1 hypothetical protein CL6EHI_201190 [Entamoeba histolytica]|eukprot:XP_650023.1 hypothetical protein EHI_201190 [Entamoeba histolytica HM-1:IMSS]